MAEINFWAAGQHASHVWCLLLQPTKRKVIFSPVLSLPRQDPQVFPRLLFMMYFTVVTDRNDGSYVSGDSDGGKCTGSGNGDGDRISNDRSNNSDGD